MIPTSLYAYLLKLLISVSLLFQASGSSWYQEIKAQHRTSNNELSNLDGAERLKSSRNQNIHKWPSAIMVYEIAHEFNSSSRRVIHQAMAEITLHTCVRFIPRNQLTKDYVYIQLKPDLGCRTQVGKRVGRQFLTLDNSRCIQHGRIMHELLHALGFPHEHQRPDRDDFIEIFWNNIKHGDIPQFVKMKRAWDYSMKFPYDYGSIMHYANVSPTASIDINKPIILPKKPTEVMGQRDRLSRMDVEKINAFYRCS